jgi:lysophospholipase L1-like esterase
MLRAGSRAFPLVILVCALALIGTAEAQKGVKGGGSGGGGGKGGGKGGGGSSVTAPLRVEGVGDSIMRGYNASCTRNTGLFDFLCYGGGDQNENSFLDGSSSAVTSILDRYLTLNANMTGGKAVSKSGSEMKDPAKNNFETQATALVAATTQPVRVVVELGGNDLCNRSDGTELYTDGEWTGAVDAGLGVLVNGLPDGSTVLLSSVPRVQDLRGAGILKQTGNSRVDCEAFWRTYNVCNIATADDTNLAAISAAQKRYNEILATQAQSFNADAATTGVEVVAEYQGEFVQSVGTYSFSASDINGGDCFHPSIQGQNTLAEMLWSNTPETFK